jgi:hypothetical protein
MRKIKWLIIVFILFIWLVPQSQVQSLKNKAIMQAREMGDTLLARFNNKMYYTVKADNKWPVVNGKIAFHVFSLSDTSPDFQLEYLSNKAELVKRLRHGDTIRNCFMGDMKISFSDFTDVPVTVPDTTPIKYIPTRDRKRSHVNQQKGAPKIVAQKHPAPHRKKKSMESIPSSKPIVFNNCVFGPIVSDTSEDIFIADGGQKKRPEFEENVVLINCTFMAGVEISDCDFKKDFILSGQLLSPFPSLIENCDFCGICYIYSSPELGNWQSFFNFNVCTFNESFIFTATNSDRSHFSIERSKINDVLSFGRSVPDYVTKKYRLYYSGPDYFLRLYDYTDWYAGFLSDKYSKEYELDDDTLEDFSPNDRIMYNISIKRTKIKCLDIANTNLQDCNFEDVDIEKCVDVSNSNFSYSPEYKGKQGLEDISFPRTDGVIYAWYKTFSPEAFKLGTYMEKIQIHPLVHDYFDTTTDFLQDNSNFYNSIKDYSAKKFTNDELVTSLKARYEHEKSQWERQYYEAHMKHPDGAGDFISSFFHCSLAWFLEATVSTGYKGEMRFGLWVLSLIIFFSIIYYFKHHESIIDYLNSMYNKQDAEMTNYKTLKVYKSFNGFRDYMRCLWFSCLVFVDPRLPITFFNLKVGLFGLVLAEWLCGVTAILLFLIFLASNYPFIHSLIGI